MPPRLLARACYVAAAAAILAAGVTLTVVLVNRDATDNAPDLSAAGQPPPAPVAAGLPAADPPASVQPAASPPFEPAASPPFEPAPSPPFEPPPAAPADPPALAADDADDTHVIPYDHVAHAVPGREYVAYDLDRDSVEIVSLDASRSHSHYFDPAESKLGAIVSWVWRNQSSALIAESSTPDVLFPLGTTRVFLTVEDDAGNTHTDSTNVTVLPPTREGAYCYYYPAPPPGPEPAAAAAAAAFSIADNRVNGEKPVFGEELPDINFPSIAQFPPAVAAAAFQARCTFHLDTPGGTARFTVEHHGPIRLLIDRDAAHPVIMESALPGLRNTSAEFDLRPGLEALQLWYLYTPGLPARLRLVDTPRPVFHDLSTQLPLISALSPPNSTLEGGGLLNVIGSGFWNDPQVYFGDDGITFFAPDKERSSEQRLVVNVPQALSPGVLDISVGNRFGGSNALPFKYSQDSLSPIKFQETTLMQDAAVFNIKMITNIKYGPDHRLYLASLDSFVYSLSVAQDLSVSDVCQSDSLGVNRTVIGLAFNPADTQVILYASSSIFFWGKSGREDPFLWANGQVALLQPGHDGNCLGVVGPVITGLPVSNHDHGVNGMLFDDDGLLHINVGGATNAGVPAETVGGIDESPLSAANLVADIYGLGFDGRVVYDIDDPGRARIVSGDVEVYQAGWRNSFEQTLHSNGFIYATDNGANSEFGNRSTSCTTDEPISPYHSDDKLAKVIKGKFGGHANRNRGRDDPIECVWRSPFGEPTNNYNPPIATLESSTDGIIEFTADIFGGQMKGDLLTSKFSTNDPNNNGRVYRIQLDEDGERVGETESLWEDSGLSIAMTPWGDLLMPRLYDDVVMVLRAVHEDGSEGTLTSVTPFRGPMGGGNEVLVTGTGFGVGSVALFDGEPCTDVREATDTSFKCTVPAGTGGESVQVGIRSADGTVKMSSGGYDYRYMRI